MRAEPALARAELDTLLETLVVDAAALLDGAAVARAHDLAGRGDPDGLLALDRRVTSRKLTPASRRASTTCGRNLASLVPALSEAEPVTTHAAEQLVMPLWHSLEHRPLEQTRPAPQATPQLPQLLGSVCWLTQSRPQLSKPARQATWQVPSTQVGLAPPTSGQARPPKPKEPGSRGPSRSPRL